MSRRLPIIPVPMGQFIAIKDIIGTVIVITSNTLNVTIHRFRIVLKISRCLCIDIGALTSLVCLKSCYKKYRDATSHSCSFIHRWIRPYTDCRHSNEKDKPLKLTM